MDEGCYRKWKSLSSVFSINVALLHTQHKPVSKQLLPKMGGHLRVGMDYTIYLNQTNSSVSARKASISVTEVSDIHPTPNNQKFLLTLSYIKSKNKFSPFSIWSADASNFFSRVVSPLQDYTKSEVMYLALPASWCSFYRLNPTSLNPINQYFQPCCLLCVLPKCNDITATAPSTPRWWESINSAPSAVHLLSLWKRDQNKLLTDGWFPQFGGNSSANELFQARAGGSYLIKHSSADNTWGFF